jgi:hypothetical protein
MVFHHQTNIKENDSKKSYEMAAKRFDELVSRGVIKPRGNNSFSIDSNIVTCIGEANKFLMQ